MSFSPKPPTGGAGRITQHSRASHSRNASYPNDQTQRTSSFSSESSETSPPAPYRLPPFARNQAASSSTTSLSSTTRANTRTPQDPPSRNASPAMAGGQPSQSRDRMRQYSQGFFEPSLPITSLRNSSLSNLTTSQIAAQTAMHVQPNTKQDRRLSGQSPDQPAQTASSHIPPRKVNHPTPIQTNHAQFPIRGSSAQANHAAVAEGRGAAATAASAAFPRSPASSPSLTNAEYAAQQQQYQQQLAQQQLREESKPAKEKPSRMKLFSKPKAVNTDKKTVAGTGPGTPGIYGPSAMLPYNQSTTSLADSIASTNNSIYSSANASTSTLVPSDRGLITEKDKEKHKHHFLYRQRQKLKDDHQIVLSSASSNSRPTDPLAPQPLYSFQPPPSPGLAGKSKTGFDLRHGGRALREKRKEERAAAVTGTDSLGRDPIAMLDFQPPPHVGTAGNFTPGPATPDSAPAIPAAGALALAAEDAWPALRARLLPIFGGDEVRTPVEDLNRLVTVHIQLCIQRRTPQVLLEHVRALIWAGFDSVEHTLRGIPDDRLVPHLVEIWASVFSTILPFLQAVFLPLDLELKGHGPLMSSREASGFWSILPPQFKAAPPGVNASNEKGPAADAYTPLDVRSLTLLQFRDNIILSRYEPLLNIFSRLSLDSINFASISLSDMPPPPRPHTANSSSGSGGHADPSSYNSQSSTMLDSSNAGSLGARSRATSNTSAGSFHSVNSMRPLHGYSSIRSVGVSSAAQQQAQNARDPAKITEIAAKMLQCVSVLSGLKRPGNDLNVRGSEHNSGAENLHEDAEVVTRQKMERLARELKLNWLGRGRTGGNRKGLVGTRLRIPVGTTGGPSAHIGVAA